MLTNGLPRMKTHQFLTANGIPCTVVLDSAVAYVMERVDMVLVGSEAVVESGVCHFFQYPCVADSFLLFNTFRASFLLWERTKWL